MKYLLFLSLIFLFSCKKKDTLQSMITERPEMQCPGYDTLLHYARLKGARWSSDPHPVSSGADFQKGIQLREGMAPEEAWSSLFFETYNLRSERAFREIYREGVKGKHTRNSWVIANSRIEYLNGQEFIKFAEDTLKPFYRRHGLGTSEIDRMLKIFNSPFTDWISSPQDKYPWSYWGKYYDDYLQGATVKDLSELD
jgi:hypothetical protein